jgi:hypothetical protein
MRGKEQKVCMNFMLISIVALTCIASKADSQTVNLRDEIGEKKAGCVDTDTDNIINKLIMAENSKATDCLDRMDTKGAAQHLKMVVWYLRKSAGIWSSYNEVASPTKEAADEEEKAAALLNGAFDDLIPENIKKGTQHILRANDLISAAFKAIETTNAKPCGPGEADALQG